jgi:phage terminase large subunit
MATLDGDVNSACDIATDTALSVQADKFVWDATGIGLSLRRQISDALSAKGIELEEFFSSGKVDNPNDIPDSANGLNAKQLTNDEFFANIRAQRYFLLAMRVWRTYRAVVHGEYTDPAEMISFSSECKDLTMLRTELCRIPRKRGTGNGYQIASKQEMKKLGMKSPNLADAVMMSGTDFNPAPVLDYSQYNVPSGVGW